MFTVNFADESSGNSKSFSPFSKRYSDMPPTLGPAVIPFGRSRAKAVLVTKRSTNRTWLSARGNMNFLIYGTPNVIIGRTPQKTYWVAMNDDLKGPLRILSREL